ncbi:hypothetical protein M977_04427 [Buttiauxella gaviniae ATCC 51604]|uniref:Ead/Ea22-like family protein n=2 Tax=Buttiauxella gaviniae TaxID=82990 RepID=A0A1B7HMG6_9ENTR|nr:hypothetical protein M977_04427 [Buttiauxella gaviniae ATCC 51604]
MDKGIEALIARLNERYGPTEVPKCRLCAGQLSLQRSGREGNVWACSGQIDDEHGWHYAPGRDIADTHYQESQWYDYSGGGDSDVMELIAELEQAQKDRENWRMSFDNERLRADKLASEQAKTYERIAYLEKTLRSTEETLIAAGDQISELEAAPPAPIVAENFDAWFRMVMRPAMEFSGIKDAEQKMVYSSTQLAWNAAVLNGGSDAK